MTGRTFARCPFRRRGTVRCSFACMRAQYVEGVGADIVDGLVRRGEFVDKLEPEFSRMEDSHAEARVGETLCPVGIDGLNDAAYTLIARTIRVHSNCFSPCGEAKQLQLRAREAAWW